MENHVRIVEFDVMEESGDGIYPNRTVQRHVVNGDPENTDRSSTPQTGNLPFFALPFGLVSHVD